MQNMQAESSLKTAPPPQTQTTNQYIIRLLKNENIPICLAACNIVFKSPFTVWCSFLSKLSSTNFIIFFHVRSDFNNCSCSFILLVWKYKIFGFFKIYFKLLYGGFFKIKDQIKTPLSNCIQSVCSNDCKQFPYYVSLHPFLSVRKEWDTYTHTLSLLYSSQGRILYKAKLLQLEEIYSSQDSKFISHYRFPQGIYCFNGLVLGRGWGKYLNSVSLNLF